MSDRASKISTLDRVISYISPSTGIKRIQAKAVIDAYAFGSSAGYTGKKTWYGLSNTMPVGDDTDYSLARLRNYSRSLLTLYLYRSRSSLYQCLQYYRYRTEDAPFDFGECGSHIEETD